MEFLKHLKNIYGDKELGSMRQEYIMCGLTEFDLPQKSKGIEFNNDIILSVQGSFGHYCTPRKTLPYDQYKSMEFAILKNHEFTDVKEIIDTDKFDEYYDDTVYGYVPVSKIEWLYQELKKKYGLKGE